MNSIVFDEATFSDKSRGLHSQVVRDDIVKKHLAIIDSYHTPTSVHLSGVALMMAEFVTAGIVDFGEGTAHAAVRAAILHDIGKIAIPLSTLDKPGALDDAEWIEMKKHPLIGFHHLAFSTIGPKEAEPVLLHHTLQVREYPSKAECTVATAIHGLNPTETRSEETLTITTMLAVADQIEARYPIHDDENPMANIRSYANRRYSKDRLPELVRSSFIEAGQVRDVNLEWLLDKLIECSQDVISKKTTSNE
jgi:hypothetical protein